MKNEVRAARCGPGRCRVQRQASTMISAVYQQRMRDSNTRTARVSSQNLLPPHCCCHCHCRVLTARRGARARGPFAGQRGGEARSLASVRGRANIARQTSSCALLAAQAVVGGIAAARSLPVMQSHPIRLARPCHFLDCAQSREQESQQARESTTAVHGSCEWATPAVAVYGIKVRFEPSSVDAGSARSRLVVRPRGARPGCGCRTRTPSITLAQAVEQVEPLNRPSPLSFPVCPRMAT